MSLHCMIKYVQSELKRTKKCNLYRQRRRRGGEGKVITIIIIILIIIGC
jgi:hypothetical protein